MENKTQYIIRSNINSSLILCTNGQFMPGIFIGPGHELSAKIYKTRKGAEKANRGIVEKI